MTGNISKLKGHAAVLGANIIFGLNVPVTKSLLDNWMTPLSYMVTRTIWAAAVFWVIQCFLMPLGMKRIRATTVSVYMNLQPVVASITAIAIGQDTFSWFMPLAGILVLSGAYIVSTSKAKN